MTARSARQLTTIAALLAVATAACAVFAFRGRIAEEYWFWRLLGSDEAGQKAAIRVLGERRSVRAVPGILQVFPRYPGLSSHALVKIGKPALPAIYEALLSPGCRIKLELLAVVDWIDPRPTCVRALGVPDPPPLPPEE